MTVARQLEHCTTAAAVEAVKACGPTVGGKTLSSVSSLSYYQPQARPAKESPCTNRSEPNAATITAHHLYLTSDEAACDPLAFCKPIPKKPTDRDALVRAAVGGDPKFFL